MHWLWRTMRKCSLIGNLNEYKQRVPKLLLLKNEHVHFRCNFNCSDEVLDRLQFRIALLARPFSSIFSLLALSGY